VYGTFEATPQPALLVTLQDMQDIVTAQQQQPQQQQQAQPAALLLDTRNSQQYSGAVRRGARGGRVPGAVSLPRARLLDGAGRLKTLDQQRSLLQQAGVVLPSAAGPEQGSVVGSSQQQQQQPPPQPPPQRVVLYCNGGVAACTAALALHRLGHRHWAVYDGSWNEYAASGLPVERPGDGHAA
jgi:thiosulfate/3-mercaptopyruvate sulfurtransferase